MSVKAGQAQGVSHIKRRRSVAHQVELGTDQAGFVLRRVMRDTCPPTDLRQSGVRCSPHERTLLPPCQGHARSIEPLTAGVPQGIIALWR
jgi:hypothetical protein